MLIFLSMHVTDSTTKFTDFITEYRKENKTELNAWNASAIHAKYSIQAHETLQEHILDNDVLYYLDGDIKIPHDDGIYDAAVVYESKQGEILVQECKMVLEYRPKEAWCPYYALVVMQDEATETLRIISNCC